MALKKVYDDKKHTYLKINHVEYVKNNCISIEIFLELRDSENNLLHRDAMRLLPMHSEQDFFQIDVLSQQDENLLKSCYFFIKKYKKMFSDWEDC
jgi:hypothetical protein